MRQDTDALLIVYVPFGHGWHAVEAGGYTPSPRVGNATCTLAATVFVFGGIEVSEGAAAAERARVAAGGGANVTQGGGGGRGATHTATFAYYDASS